MAKYRLVMRRKGLFWKHVIVLQRSVRLMDDSLDFYDGWADAQIEDITPSLLRAIQNADKVL